MTNTYSNRSNARRAAKAAAQREGVSFDAITFTQVGDEWTFALPKTAPQAVMLSTEDEDLGLMDLTDAKAEAQSIADEMGMTVYGRDPISDEVLFTAEPTPAPAPAKVSAPAKTEAPAPAPAPVKVEAPAQVEAKEKTPSGMTAKIIELASRDQGATPKELNDLTNWKGAPWKWLMQNPKGTGFADRWGYSLTIEKDGRAVTYKLTKAA